MHVQEGEAFRLNSAMDVEYLRSRLGKLLQARAHGWAISRRVGHLSLPSGEVLHIGSCKADTKALFAWVAYADPGLDILSTFDDIDNADDENTDLGVFLARLFVRELISVSQKSGVVRDYRSLCINGPSVRGRIDFATLTRRAASVSCLPCIAWERTTDAPPNPFLAAALRVVAYNSCMRKACGISYHRAASLLVDVRPAIDNSLLGGWHTLSRLAKPYERAVALARAILLHGGVKAGYHHGSEYLVDLDRLFESAVIRAFQDSDYTCSAQHAIYYQRLPHGTGHMNIDLFIQRNHEGALVVDAKYKSEISSANLQQMVTYCLMTGTPNAVLVIPQAQGEPSMGYRLFPLGDVLPINVQVVTFDVSCKTQAEWQASAVAMVSQVMSHD